MALVVIGLSHHSAPVALRERFAFEDARVPAVLEMLRNARIAEEAVLLSTCNRVELYAVTSIEPPVAFDHLREFLVMAKNYSDPLTNELYTLGEPHSPGRNRNSWPAQKGLRCGLAAWPYRQPSQQSFPEGLQRR
jgi:glutamyl-tRNA reductase